MEVFPDDLPPRGIHDQFGNAWYVKPVPSIGFLLFFTLVQWYMIVLTLNSLQQRSKLTEFCPDCP
jgi:hypothetical protein